MLHKRFILGGKRGDLLTIWWFLVLAIVGAGIVAGVVSYYGAEADARRMEADILSMKLVNCFSRNGMLDAGIFSDSLDVFASCGLDKKVFEAGSNFYFRISAYDSDGGLIKQIHGGNRPYEKDCGIEKEVIAEKYVRCVTRSESVNYYKDGSKTGWGKIEVLAGSNQVGGRVQIA